MNMNTASLCMAADILEDLEKVRMMNASRLRQMTRDISDKDGEQRGFGLADTDPEVVRLAAIISAMEQVEKDAVKNLQRELKRHPLHPFIARQKGVGDKTAARLLASIGDPYMNSATGEPRTVSALWAYCGLHVSEGEAARRKKGVQANWSTKAKTRAWLIIEACMKQISPECKTDTGIGNHVKGCTCSPYRVIVDERRQHTAISHPDWTPGHSLNDGMRVASKALLRDLWRESRAIHLGAETELAAAA